MLARKNKDVKDSLFQIRKVRKSEKMIIKTSITMWGAIEGHASSRPQQKQIFCIFFPAFNPSPLQVGHFHFIANNARAKLLSINSLSVDS